MPLNKFEAAFRCGVRDVEDAIPYGPHRLLLSCAGADCHIGASVRCDSEVRRRLLAMTQKGCGVRDVEDAIPYGPHRLLLSCAGADCHVGTGVVPCHRRSIYRVPPRYDTEEVLSGVITGL